MLYPEDFDLCSKNYYPNYSGSSGNDEECSKAPEIECDGSGSSTK